MVMYMAFVFGIAISIMLIWLESRMFKDNKIDKGLFVISIIVSIPALLSMILVTSPYGLTKFYNDLVIRGSIDISIFEGLIMWTTITMFLGYMTSRIIYRYYKISHTTSGFYKRTNS